MKNEQVQHQPVMLNEVIAALNLKQDGMYVDATYGRGGHSRAILATVGPNARLFVMDKDPQAIQDARSLSTIDARVVVFEGSFRDLSVFLNNYGVLNKIDGLLLDLGVSSPQLDEAARGFSFMREGPLDMRMDPRSGISVAEWLSKATEHEIAEVLRVLGEEKFSKRIAREIISVRQKNPIVTTVQLANIISQAIPFKDKHKHPATRTFQAMRIFINHELEDLEEILQQVDKVLAVRGRLVVISFHSLEDRIVKRFIAQQERGDNFPRHMPVTKNQLRPKLLGIGRAIKPTSAELQHNVRARSAVLRVAEKIAEVIYD